MGPRLFGRGRAVNTSLDVPANVASMGPRLFGRGRLAHDTFSENFFVHASMGPRLFGRGRTSVVVVRSELDVELQWGRVCLDAEGVAKATRSTSMKWLQWGRVCLDAEGVAKATRSTSMKWLQWGRVCLDAEGEASADSGDTGGELQWGRVCLDAEGSIAPAIHFALASSFNGAASVWTRKEFKCPERKEL